MHSYSYSMIKTELGLMHGELFSWKIIHHLAKLSMFKNQG